MTGQLGPSDLKTLAKSSSTPSMISSWFLSALLRFCLHCRLRLLRNSSNEYDRSIRAVRSEDFGQVVINALDDLELVSLSPSQILPPLSFKASSQFIQRI